METVDATKFLLQTIGEAVLKNEKYFCELDGVVGDGDFGYSLARGFEKVFNEWDTLDCSSPGALLKKVAMVITSRVGGVSGSIWGTAFLRAGMTAGVKTELTKEDVIAMCRSAIEGVKKRGETDVGDKTLLDAFVPAVGELEKEFREGKESAIALHSAAVVARRQAEATKDMIAKKGRASYTGERSIGSVDAGAMAVAVLFEAVEAAWQIRLEAP
jgi:dihydroxyacetone kinase/dihydroxyacetone kinase-like protein